MANDQASLPVAFRLYLHEAWAADPARRAKAGVPDDVTFLTEPRIALDQIRRAVEAGITTGVVLADAGYGVDTAFRNGLRAMNLDYVVGVQSSTGLWPPGQGPLLPKPWSGRRRPPSLYRRDGEHKPVSAKAIATALPDEPWQIVTWRECTNMTLASQFAAVRVRLAHRDHRLTEPHPEE